MRLEKPCPVTRDTLTFPVEEIEPMLQAPPMDVPEFPGAKVQLRDGREMFIRPAKLEEADMLAEYVRKVMIGVEHDFYDIVGARIYAEIIGWKRKRLKDPYQLVGVIDGELAAFCNGRLMNEDINISLHTFALARGLRAGAIMYYAKCHYAFEIIKNKEFWSTFESYNGWKRWGLGMAQPTYAWPEVQHELGGARVYYIRKNYWDAAVKQYIQQMVGADLDFNVSDKMRKDNETIRMPEGVNV